MLSFYVLPQADSITESLGMTFDVRLLRMARLDVVGCAVCDRSGESEGHGAAECGEDTGGLGSVGPVKRRLFE